MRASMRSCCWRMRSASRARGCTRGPSTSPTRRSARRSNAWSAARERGEPIAYLTGHREFWSLDLAVTPDVLIPRHETELLVELALARIPRDRDVRIADLGTGSGAIALALAHERPRAQRARDRREQRRHWTSRATMRVVSMYATSTFARRRLVRRARSRTLRSDRLESAVYRSARCASRCRRSAPRADSRR